MRDLKARVGKGSLWISATRGLVNLLGLVSTIVLARLLVPNDFGLVAIGTTMLAILTQITDMQITQAIVRHQDPTREHLDSAWTMAVLRGVLLGVIFAALGPLMAGFYEDPRLAGVMYVLGFSVMLSGLNNPRRVLLQRDLIFWQDFVLNVSEKLLTLIVSVAIAYIYHSYWALLLGTLAGRFASVAISYMAVPYIPRPSFKKAGELWSFSFWLTLSQIVNTLNWRSDQLLIGKMLGSHDLGLYTVGDNFARLPTREATLPLTGTIFPAFARIKNEPERLRRAYQRSQAMLTAIALPLGVGVALVAYPLVYLAMGEKWLPVAMVIQILASVFAVQTLGSLAQPLMMALGHTKLLFRRDIQLFVLRLPLLIAGMYYDGLRGMLIARTISGTVGILFNVHMVRQFIHLGFAEQFKANGRTFAGIIVMALVVYAVQAVLPADRTVLDQALLLCACATAGGIAYVATSVGLWLGAGRPDGPEAEVLGVLQSARQKFARGTRLA